MRLRPRSLQAQLAIRLAIVILVATALGVGAIVYEGMNAADALGNEHLVQRAAEIAQNVTAGSGRPPHLELPAKLDQTYRSPARTEIFAMQAADGRLIAASEPDLAAVIGRLIVHGHETPRPSAGRVRLDGPGLLRTGRIGRQCRRTSHHPCCADV